MPRGYVVRLIEEPDGSQIVNIPAELEFPGDEVTLRPGPRPGTLIVSSIEADQSEPSLPDPGA